MQSLRLLQGRPPAACNECRLVLCRFLSQLLAAVKFRLGRDRLLDRSGLDVACARISGNDDTLLRDAALGQVESGRKRTFGEQPFKKAGLTLFGCLLVGET